MDGNALLLGEILVLCRDAVLGVPRENVANCRLPCLVTPSTVDSTSVDNSEDARNLVQLLIVNYVAVGGAHDGGQLTRLDGISTSNNNVRVNIARSDCDSFRQPQNCCRFAMQTTNFGSQRQNRARHLVLENSAEALRNRFQVFVRGVMAILVHALIARVASRVSQFSCQLPGQPVHHVDEVRSSVVNIAGLLVGLQDLRQQQLGRKDSTVTCQPRLVTFLSGGNQAVRLLLRTVVLPQLDPRMRIIRILGFLAKRHAVFVRYQDGCRRAVHANSDHASGVDSGVLDGSNNYTAKNVLIIARVLQRVARRQRLAISAIQRLVHDAVRILGNSSAKHFTVVCANHNSTPR